MAKKIIRKSKTCIFIENVFANKPDNYTVKGQLIPKCFYGVFNSSEKQIEIL